MRRTAHIFFIAFLLLLSRSAVSQSHWKQRASSPFGHLGPAFYFSSGTKIYVARSYSGAKDTLYAWEQTTDTWSKIGGFPGIAKASAAVEYNGKAYVICGNTSTGFTNEVWEYTIATNTWAQKNNFPGSARAFHALALNSSNGKIYLSFGQNNSTLFTDLWQYDPSNDTWLQRASLPVGSLPGGRYEHCSFSRGDQVIVCFGHTGSPTTFATNNTSIFSISTNSWVSTLGGYGPPVTARISPALFTLGNTSFSGLGYIQGSPVPLQRTDFFRVPFGFLGAFPGAARFGVVSVSCNGKGYIGFGATYSSTPSNPYQTTAINELWEFNPMRCVNNSYTTALNTPITFSPVANDISYATLFNPASFALLSPPANGVSTSSLLNGAISYTPNAGFIGVDNIKYTVCDSLGNCDTARIYISVNPDLQVSATSTVLCGGESATLTANVAGAGNYTWMPGGMMGSTVVVTPSASTVYTVSATYSATTLTKTISISVAPALVLTITASSYSLCSGQNLTLTASGASSYTWMPGNQTGSTLTASPNSNTTFTLSGANASGSCLADTTILVTVPSDVFNLSVLPSTTLCGQSATLTASGTYSTYSLNAMPFNSSVVITPTSTVTYTVFASGSASGCSNYSIITISQGSAAVFSISTTNSQCGLCTGSFSSTVAGNASAYQYALSPGTCTTPVCSGLCPGLYKITVSDSAGCASYKLFSIACSGPYMGIAGVEADDNNFVIYPNPAFDQVFIESGDQTDFTYSIYNHLGQQITGSHAKEKAALSLENIAKGIYFVEARTEGKITRKKLIIH